MAFKIIRNDITKVAADVIVNSANPKPVCGGSTEAIIYEAAGYDELLDARQGVGYLEVGQVGVTPAFNLPAKSIVHVSCPRWKDGAAESVEMLRQCYVSILQQAVALEAKSIAVPLLSSGVYRFPKEVALQIASEVCGNFSDAEMEILLVVYDLEAFKKAQELFGNVEDLLKEASDKPFGDACVPDEISSVCFDLQAPRFDTDDDVKPRSKESPRLHSLSRAASIPASETTLAPQNCEKNSDEKISRVLAGYAVPKASRKKIVKPEDPIKVAIADVIKSMDDDSFQDKLDFYIERSHFEAKEVYRAANLNRKLFSKLKQDGYRPKKNTILALSIGLKLNIDEAEDLLNRVGFGFSPVSKTDAIFKYCLGQKDFYKKSMMLPIYKVNDLLEEYGEEVLGEALKDDKD